MTNAVFIPSSRDHLSTWYYLLGYFTSRAALGHRMHFTSYTRPFCVSKWIHIISLVKLHSCTRICAEVCRCGVKTMVGGEIKRQPASTNYHFESEADEHFYLFEHGMLLATVVNLNAVSLARIECQSLVSKPLYISANRCSTATCTIESSTLAVDCSGVGIGELCAPTSRAI